MREQDKIKRLRNRFAMSFLSRMVPMMMESARTRSSAALYHCIALQQMASKTLTKGGYQLHAFNESNNVRDSIHRTHLSRTALSTSIRSFGNLRQLTPFDPHRRQTTSHSSRAAGHVHTEKVGCRKYGRRQPDETITVTFIDKDGDETVIKDAAIGESMLEIAHANDVELEGACEGSLACSTCHVIVEDEDHFDSLPEATDDENDMLDLAFGLTET